MTNTKKFFLYASYIIAAFIFFLYVLFPSDAVKKYIQHKLEGINPDISVSIDHINPAFPPGVRLNAVSLYHTKSLLLNAETVKIVPRIFSLFSSTKTLSFKGAAYDGIINGKADIGGDTGQMKLDADLSGIQIKDIPFVKNLTGIEKEKYKVVGILNGTITFSENKGSSRTMGAKLEFSDCKVNLKDPIFNHENFIFSKIKTDLATVRNRLQIKSCDIEGDKINANFSGSILTKNNLGSSNLNLKGEVQLQPLFFKNINQNILASIFPKKMSGNNSFFLTIGGTIDQPEFTLK
jgi:type II secretion system protein N